MEFKINTIPPTYNQHFKIDFRRRIIYLSKEAKEFKKLVFIHTPPYKIKEGAMYQITIQVYSNWWCKNGNIRRKDIQNLDKLLIDAMFEKFGADDSVIFRTRVEKLPLSGEYKEGQEDYTLIKLEEL